MKTMKTKKRRNQENFDAFKPNQIKNIKRAFF